MLFLVFQFDIDIDINFQLCCYVFWTMLIYKLGQHQASVIISYNKCTNRKSAFQLPNSGYGYKEDFNYYLEDDLNIFTTFFSQYFFQLCEIKFNTEKKKTLKLLFERRPPNFSNIFLNISSSQCRIKLPTENQPPSLLNSRDSFEEDLKIRTWKKTSIFSLSIFRLIG